ncbi:hypothetical protein NPIL_394601 [Nephila pilipes]|uniref:Uncharacterized protein n=1 Tax=Nephila pilipes TaxID=299642 RepID=A0A8X6Q2Q8_NEPPI|nr:hypothetical protein NPIL_394601 [Nephila pilipes]
MDSIPLVKTPANTESQGGKEGQVSLKSGLTVEEIRNLLPKLSDKSDEGSDNDLIAIDKSYHLSIEGDNKKTDVFNTEETLLSPSLSLVVTKLNGADSLNMHQRKEAVDLSYPPYVEYIEKTETRGVIKFLHLKSYNVPQIHEKMMAVDENKGLSYDTVVVWWKRIFY